MALDAARLPRVDMRALSSGSISFWLALLGIAAMLVPTVVTMAREHWTTEEGVHGPIILATGLWLIWRERAVIAAEARPLSSWLWVPPMIVLGAIWVFARTFGVESVETSSIYLFLLLTGLAYWGPAVMKKLWFPAIYLAFLIIPPGSLIVDLTQPLKIWISMSATELLHSFGYPVAHTGAIIQVGQYQLLVATACAGLMSIISLTAIGLLYVHLNWNSNLRRAAILMLAIVPIAVFANLVRVIILILLTYYSGSSVAQGFMHEAAGLITFAVSLGGMFAADSLLSFVIRDRETIQ